MKIVKGYASVLALFVALVAVNGVFASDAPVACEGEVVEGKTECEKKKEKTEEAAKEEEAAA